jgi:hypothetical protein
VQGARIKANQVLIDATDAKFNIGGTLAMTLNSTGLLVNNTTGFNSVANIKMKVGGRFLSGISGVNAYSFGTADAGGFVINDASDGVTESRLLTLNATGLGIGASPTSKLTIGTAAYAAGTLSGTSSLYSTVAQGLVVLADGFNISTRTGGDRFTLDTSGNVGIGVTPSAWFSTRRAASIGGATSLSGYIGSPGTELWTNTYLNAAGNAIYVYSNYEASRFYSAGGAFVWENAPNSGAGGAGTTATLTPRMTLDASGNLLVGKVTTAATALGGVAYIGRVDCSRDTGNAATFNHTTAGNLVGNIAITSTATTYNSASDYRLKEAVQPLSGGLARVSALKPSIYKWKVDGSSGEGFLAHELAEVVPAAVTGEKDAVDADGKPAYQGVDLSKVVPVLVAAIQELTARVQTLEAK